MKKLLIVVFCLLCSSILSWSQVKVDFGDLKDGMVIPRGQLGLTQNDTLGTILFNTSDSAMYLDNGVEFVRIPFANAVDELNSTDKRVKVSAENRMLSLRLDGISTLTVDTAGRLHFLTSNNNTYVGTNAGANHVEGQFNSFFGYNSGYSIKKTTESTMIGYAAGYFSDSTTANTFLGYSAGVNSKGDFNTFLGYNTGAGHREGNGNVGIGAQTLSNDSIGQYNVAIGANNMTQNRLGHFNVSLGYRTLDDFRSGTENIGIGSSAMEDKMTGSYNIAIGKDAGRENTNGDRNVFIGTGAGFYEKGNAKLIIEQNPFTDPLILGDFDKDELVIQGQLSVNNIQPQGALHIKQKSDPTAVVPGQTLDTLTGITLERSNGDTTWHVAIDAFNGLNFSIGNTLKAYVDPGTGKWITATGASPFTSIPTKSKDSVKKAIQNVNVYNNAVGKSKHSNALHLDIAELNEHLPQTVLTNGRVTGIDYDQITLLNFQIIQELIKENEMLKGQLKKLGIE